MKHTKGPWKVKCQIETECKVFSNRCSDAAYFIETEGYQCQSEIEANEKLISTAPELLYAAQFAEIALQNLATLKAVQNSEYSLVLENALSVLQVAINKAEGK